MLDPRLRLLGRKQFHEVAPFQIEQPLFVHETARLHIAAA